MAPYNGPAVTVGFLEARRPRICVDYLTFSGALRDQAAKMIARAGCQFVIAPCAWLLAPALGAAEKVGRIDTRQPHRVAVAADIVAVVNYRRNAKKCGQEHVIVPGD